MGSPGPATLLLARLCMQSLDPQVPTEYRWLLPRNDLVDPVALCEQGLQQIP